VVTISTTTKLDIWPTRYIYVSLWLFTINISCFINTLKMPVFVIEMLCFLLDRKTVPKDEIYRAAQKSRDIRRNM